MLGLKINSTKRNHLKKKHKAKRNNEKIKFTEQRRHNYQFGGKS